MANSMDCILVKVKDKTVTLKEFFEMTDSSLNESEKKIREALAYLYEKNDKEPPLFKEFPDRGEKKLTIDCTTIPMAKWITAWYKNDDNIIEFTSSHEIVGLISVLAHELKHAEQASKECLSFAKNQTQGQQLSFLKEAQAYTFDKYISSLLKKDEKNDIILGEAKSDKRANLDSDEEDEYEEDEEDEYEEDEEDDFEHNYGTYLMDDDDVQIPNIDEELANILQEHLEKEQFDYSEYEQEAIAAVLPILFCGNDAYYRYRRAYDNNLKVSIETEKGLDNIPSSFHLSEKTKNILLEILDRIPPTDLVETSENTVYRTFLYYLTIWDGYGIESIGCNDYLLDKAGCADYMLEDAMNYYFDLGVKNHESYTYFDYFKTWEGRIGERSRLLTLEACLNEYVNSTIKNSKEDVSEAIEGEYDPDIINEAFDDIDLSVTNVDWKNKEISTKSLQEVDKKEREIIFFCVNQLEDQICEIEPKKKVAKLKEAIQYGHVRTTQVLLNSLKKTNPDMLNQILSDIASNWKNTKKLPTEQQKYISQNIKEILGAFLDLKDENNDCIIQPQAIKQLLTHADTETRKSLAMYQQKNPMDERFCGVQIPLTQKRTSIKDKLSSAMTHPKQKQKSNQKVITPQVPREM